MKIAIVGAGLIGRSWGALFAANGEDVAVYDPMAQVARQAVEWIHEAVPLLRQAEGGSPDRMQLRVRVATSLEDAVAEADYVQESAPEDEQTKRKLFVALDRAAPIAAVIASSTSALPGSRFLDVPVAPERCIVAHPANPPHILPLVEVAPAPWTAQSTVDRCMQILRAIGQIPVLIRRETPGFVMNRLQAAVINESVALVADGVIDAGDLDRVMRYSLGLRWAFMGPFETMELNAPRGFADYATKFGASYAQLGRTLRVGDEWPSAALDVIETWRREQLDVSAIPERQRWRDALILQLRQCIEAADRQTGEPSRRVP